MPDSLIQIAAVILNHGNEILEALLRLCEGVAYYLHNVREVLRRHLLVKDGAALFETFQHWFCEAKRGGRQLLNEMLLNQRQSLEEVADGMGVASLESD